MLTQTFQRRQTGDHRFCSYLRRSKCGCHRYENDRQAQRLICLINLFPTPEHRYVAGACLAKTWSEPTMELKWFCSKETKMEPSDLIFIDSCFTGRVIFHIWDPWNRLYSVIFAYMQSNHSEFFARFNWNDWQKSTSKSVGKGIRWCPFPPSTTKLDLSHCTRAIAPLVSNTMA